MDHWTSVRPDYSKKEQTEGFDHFETFAPSARFHSIRLLALAAILFLFIRGGRSDFQNFDLEEEIDVYGAAGKDSSLLK